MGDRKITLKNGWKKIVKSNLVVAFLINCFFLILVLLFCDIKYEVSDDFVMSTILSGAYGGTQNPHMIFVNILWGYLLIPLYKIWGGISWYFVSQMVLIFLASTAITFFLLENLDRARAVMLTLIMIFFFTNDAYILVQFTKTAMFAIMAGAVIFVDALFHEKGIRRTVAGGVLCLSGTLIRFSDIYIAGGFLIFILLYEFFRLIRRAEDKKRVVKKITKIAVAGIGLIGLAFGMYAVDREIYKSNDSYAYFLEYGSARGHIVDYTDYGYDAYAEELEKINVSENDYYMMKKWTFLDDNVFTLEKMQKTADIIVQYQKGIWNGWENLIEQMQERNILSYPVCLACMLVCVLGIFLNIKKYWTAIIVNLIGWIYIVYFFIRERNVYRIEFSIFLGILLCSFYFWSEIEGKLLNNVEIRKKCVIISMLLCGFGGILYLPDRTYKLVSEEDKKYYIEEVFNQSWNYDARKYRKVVNKIETGNGLLEEIHNNKENLYLLDFNTTIQTLYYEWCPWENVSDDEYSNYFYLGSITSNFPDIKNYVDEKGMSNGLKALVNDNVYLVDNCYVDMKVDYLKEHYYPNARAELYKEIDGYQIWKLYKE